MKVILPEKQRRTIEIVQEINPHQWVRVNGTPYFVSAGDPQYKGFNNQQAIEKTLKETPFRVTPPRIFMPHLTQVCNAVRKRNPIKLYDGASEPFSRAATDDIYQRRTTNTWIHLDARFEQRGDELWMLTDHALVDGELKPLTQQPLERRVLRKDGFVELRWNSQGLPVKKSRRQEYEIGKNMNYFAPIDDCVVGFYADSGRFVLNCSGDLLDSGAALGVFPYAEGVAKK